MQIDLLDAEWHNGDPYADFRWLRDNAPVYHDPTTGMWGLSRYDDVRRAELMPQVFSSDGGSRPGMTFGRRTASMIDRDDPEHSAHRKLVYHQFTPRSVGTREDWVREIVNDLIDQVAATGEADFINDIAAPLPMRIIASIMGFPQERWLDLQHWCDLLICLGDGPRFATPERMQGYMNWLTYAPDFVAQRRKEPLDDLVSLLAHAEIDGETLSDEWVIGESLLILTGGNETTRLSIAGGMIQLSEHRDQWNLLVGEPSRIPGAVEEMVRHTTPIHTMARTTTQDVTWHDTTIPKHSKVILLYASANRDERVFDDPEVFDITREPNPHLGFGIGTHFCLGASLARMEIRVLYEQLVRRLPDIRVEPGHTPHWETTGGAFVRGMHDLPVVFTPQR